MATVLHRELPGYHGREGQPYAINAPTFSRTHPDLADIGLGVSLYFENLRTLFWTFAGVFLLALPGVIIPFIANPRAAAEAQRVGGALGVLRTFTITGMFKTSATNPYGCDSHTCTLRTGSVVDTLPLVSAIVYLDLVYSLVLLAAVKAIRKRCKTRVREVELEGVSAADYAVVVWGLPADASTEEIRVHFNRIAAMDGVRAAATADQADLKKADPGEAGGAEAAGADREGEEVAAVHIARGEGELLGEWRKLAEMQVAYRRLRAAADRRRSPKGAVGEGSTSEPAVDRAAASSGPAETEVDKNMAALQLNMTKQEAQASSGPAETEVDKNMAALQLNMTKQEARVRQMQESGLAGRAVCAFVVFERAAARVACLRRYSSQSILRSMEFMFSPSKKLCLRDHFALKVLPAPEPSDVLWENLERGEFERLIRRFMGSLAVLALVAIALVVILADKTFLEQLRGSRSECADPVFAATCNAAVPWNSTVPAAIAAAGLDAGCNSSASLRLSQLWGACRLPGGDGVRFPAGPVPAPLVVNTSTVPPEPLLFSGAACRYSNRTGWINIAKIPQVCSTAAAVSAPQWTALVAAGWAGVSSLAGGSGFVNASRCEACRCEALMDASPDLWWDSLDAGPHRAGIRSPGGSAPCSGQASALAMFTALECVAIALVLGVNMLLYVAVDRLATAERHHTVAGREAAVALGIFAAEFVNTFLVVILVYARIDAVRAHLPSSTGPASFLPIFAGPFPDFTDQWAAVVGAQILITVVINVFSPVFSLLATLANRFIYLPLAAIGVGPAWTQRELNSLYQADKFSLGQRYGRLLNMLFGCLLLSSKMPILLLLAAFILVSTEWIDRIYLLRFCRLPPRFSHRLSDTALELMDFAVVLHLCVGCWVFSATNARGSAMFPRPAAVEQASAVLEAAGLAGAGGINCTLRKTSELCTNGTANTVCQWNKPGVCVPVVSQLGATDPLGAAPRLLNGLMLPYLVITLAILLAVMVRHTPMWRLVKHITSDVRELMDRNSLATKASKRSIRERPNYSVALHSGLFGKIPATYDIQHLPPYDEVFADPGNRLLRQEALAKLSGQQDHRHSTAFESASQIQSIAGEASGLEATSEPKKDHTPLDVQV